MSSQSVEIQRLCATNLARYLCALKNTTDTCGDGGNRSLKGGAHHVAKREDCQSHCAVGLDGVLTYFPSVSRPIFMPRGLSLSELRPN